MFSKTLFKPSKPLSEPLAPVPRASRRRSRRSSHPLEVQLDSYSRQRRQQIPVRYSLGPSRPSTSGRKHAADQGTQPQGDAAGPQGTAVGTREVPYSRQEEKEGRSSRRRC